MTNFQDCLFKRSRILTSVFCSLAFFAFFASFFCESSVLADYNAATADLSSTWTVTNSNGITLNGNDKSFANHTGTLTINSDPVITLSNGAVFEQSGTINPNKKAIHLYGNGRLNITYQGQPVTARTTAFWGFYFYGSNSIIDNSCVLDDASNIHRGQMAFTGSNIIDFHADGEFIFGRNTWIIRNATISVDSNIHAKISQSTMQGIDPNAGFNLTGNDYTATFNVGAGATLDSTVRIFDEGTKGGAITKTGAGTMTIFNSNNTYKKATTISAGKLVLSGAGNLQNTSGVSIASGATLEFKDSDADGKGGTVTFSRVISNAGNVIKSGSGTVNLTATNTYTGTTTINGGTLIAANANAVGKGALIIDNATLSSVQGTIQSSSVTVTGNSTFISSSGWNLFKGFSGSGTLTLTGSGYLAIKDGYSATNYTGSFIVGTSDAVGSLALESNNILNGATNIRAVNGKINWKKYNQSFNSFEYLDGNMAEMTGTLTLSDEFKYNSSTDLTVPGVIAGTADLVKEGSGTLTLSQAPSYTGNTTVNEGTLALTADGTLNNLSGGSLNPDGTVAQSGAIDASGKNLTLNNSLTSQFIGSITAQAITVNAADNAALKVYTGASGKVDVQSLTVSSGEFDLKGYMTGSIMVNDDAVFSPGNSIGNAVFGGAFTLKEGATLLIEQDESGIDTLTASSFNIDPNAVLELALGSVQPGATYDIIFQKNGDTAINFEGDQATDEFWNNLLSPESAYYWKLSVNNNVVSAMLDANAVPEPSTWALLVLGAAGLMYLRKRVRS